ncbi:hypothetical protein MSG28_016093 [Choristoneura fumiferana]|uniref:Uncharacterized protein n=1 Tax=Choristoneura fumiferana TaxID=7141 RepID=A0ACC0K5G8_CHOFU|nr:hypothetical protein MSG28_016093 [Choristoneura fumiferana]
MQSLHLHTPRVPDPRRAGPARPSRAESPELKSRLELLSRLCVPRKWLLLAQAARAKYEHLPRLEAEYLADAEHWNAAHKVVLDELLPEAVLTDDLPGIWPLLEKLNEAAERHEVSGWQNGGQALYHYIKVCDEVVGPCARSARIATTILLANPAVKQQCLHCCVSAWRIRSLVSSSGDREGVQTKLEALRPRVAAACRSLSGLAANTARHAAARAEMGARLLQLAVAARAPARHLAALLGGCHPARLHRARHRTGTHRHLPGGRGCCSWLWPPGRPPGTSPRCWGAAHPARLHRARHRTGTHRTCQGGAAAAAGCGRQGARQAPRRAAGGAAHPARLHRARHRTGTHRHLPGGRGCCSWLWPPGRPPGTSPRCWGAAHPARLHRARHRTGTHRHLPGGAAAAAGCGRQGARQAPRRAAGGLPTPPDYTAPATAQVHTATCQGGAAAAAGCGRQGARQAPRRAAGGLPTRPTTPRPPPHRYTPPPARGARLLQLAVAARAPARHLAALLGGCPPRPTTPRPPPHRYTPPPARGRGCCSWLWPPGRPPGTSPRCWGAAHPADYTAPATAQVHTATCQGARLLQLAVAARAPARHLAALLGGLPTPPDYTAPATAQVHTATCQGDARRRAELSTRWITMELAEEASEMCVGAPSPISAQT